MPTKRGCATGTTSAGRPHPDLEENQRQSLRGEEIAAKVRAVAGRFLLPWHGLSGCCARPHFEWTPMGSPHQVHGSMPTPEGRVPTATVATTVLLALAITETLLEPAFVT